MKKNEIYYSQPIKKSADGRSFNVLGGDAIMPTEAEQLMKIVRDVRPNSLLEVGTGLGASAVAVCSVLEEIGKGKLVTLDPFQDHFGHVGVSELQRLELDRWSEFLPEFAEDFLHAAAARQQTFDFIFIDGAHSVGTKMTHTFFADKCLAPNGIFAFHDVTKPCTAACVKYLVQEKKYSVVPLKPESRVNNLLRRIKYAWVYGELYSSQVLPYTHRNLVVLRKSDMAALHQ